MFIVVISKCRLSCDFSGKEICYSCIKQEDDSQEDDVMSKKGYSGSGLFGGFNHYDD